MLCMWRTLYAVLCMVYRLHDQRLVHCFLLYYCRTRATKGEHNQLKRLLFLARFNQNLNKFTIFSTF